MPDGYVPEHCVHKDREFVIRLAWGSGTQVGRANVNDVSARLDERAQRIHPSGWVLPWRCILDGVHLHDIESEQ